MRSTGGELHPLRIRDFRLLFGGFAISSIGDWLYSIALVVYVFDRTGSATWVGAASILRLAPYVLFGALGGVVADRYDRRNVLLTSDLIRALTMFLIALVVVADGPIALVLLLVFLSTTAGTPDGPAIGSIVPSICSEKQLPKANAIIGMVENVALVVGPALGGLLLLVGSISTAFALNGLTFLGASITAYLLTPKGSVIQAGAEPPGVLHQLREGIATAWGSPGVVVMFLFIFLAGLFYGHELTLIVLVAEQKLGLGGEGVGWLNAAVGVGGVAAGGIASRMASSPRSDAMLLGALVAGTAPYAILSLSDAVIIGFVAMATIGGASIALDVICTTMLQRTLPNDVHARVLSLVDTVAVAGILLGSLTAPAAVATVGLDRTLLLMGTVPLLTVVFAPKLRTLNRAAEDRKLALEPAVRMIEASDLFRSLSRQSLEAIAAVATREDVSKGRSVVVEGEPPDDIFVIVSGSFEVTSGGEGKRLEVVNTLGRGDHFGEVGILARIPRTATVTASIDSTVLRLPGRVLTDVVNQGPTTSATIIDGMIGRLSRTHPTLASEKAKEDLHVI